MTKLQTSFRAIRPLLLVIAAVSGVVVGACKEGDGDESDAPAEIQTACEAYCAKAAQCNDETNLDKCQKNCVDAMTDCMVDELDEALAKLEQCADESCDDFIGCTINVGAQCIFGL